MELPKRALSWRQEVSCGWKAVLDSKLWPIFRFLTLGAAGFKKGKKAGKAGFAAAGGKWFQTFYVKTLQKNLNRCKRRQIWQGFCCSKGLQGRRCRCSDEEGSDEESWRWISRLNYHNSNPHLKFLCRNKTIIFSNIVSQNRHPIINLLKNMFSTFILILQKGKILMLWNGSSAQNK